MVVALKQAGAAVFGEGAQLIEGVVFCYDLSRRCYLDGHQCLPHVLIDVVALFRDLALSHLRPILIDDGSSIGFRLKLELCTLGLGEPYGETVDVSESAGLEIDVEVRRAKVRPHGIEHEAENNRVGGAEDVELPADEVVMNLTLFPRPNAVKGDHEEHRSGHHDDEDDDILRESQHEVVFSRRSPSLSNLGVRVLTKIRVFRIHCVDRSEVDGRTSIFPQRLISCCSSELRDSFGMRTNETEFGRNRKASERSMKRSKADHLY